MRIRKARKSELPAILDMDKECFPYDTREDFRRSSAVWWVVESEGRLVGYAGGYPWRYGNENAFVLCRCGVMPGFRGKGLQKRLLRVRIAHAKREGHPLIWTYTAYDNLVSCNNLIATGFRLWAPAVWRGTRDPLGSSARWMYWKRKVV